MVEADTIPDDDYDSGLIITTLRGDYAAPTIESGSTFIWVKCLSYNRSSVISVTES